MNDNEYWVNIWKLAAIVLCVIVVSSIGSCQASKYQIRKAIEAGSTAMEAACAFDHGNVSDNSLCTITAINKNK